jgi:hypothetical protein
MKINIIRANPFHRQEHGIYFGTKIKEIFVEACSTQKKVLSLKNYKPELPPCYKDIKKCDED